MWPCAVCRVPAPQIRVFLCRPGENKGESPFRGVPGAALPVHQRDDEQLVGPDRPGEGRPSEAAAATLCGPLLDAGPPPTQESRTTRLRKAGLPRRGFAKDRNRGACSGILFVFSVAALNFATIAFFFSFFN